MIKTKKICGIYKITNPKGKIYIGQSINISKRITYYKNGHCVGQAKLFSSLKKYGWSRHRLDIIHQCSPDQLNELEEYYICLYNCFNTKHGLNLQSGGSVVKCADETKLKRSKSLKGRVFTQEWKDKIGAKSKGRMVGFKHTDESKQKMRNNYKPRIGYVPYNKGKGMSKIEKMERHRIANQLWRKREKQKRLNEENTKTEIISKVA